MVGALFLVYMPNINVPIDRVTFTISHVVCCSIFARLAGCSCPDRQAEEELCCSFSTIFSFGKNERTKLLINVFNFIMTYYIRRRKMSYSKYRHRLYCIGCSSSKMTIEEEETVFF